MKIVSAVVIALALFLWVGCVTEESGLSYEDNKQSFFGGWQDGGASYSETVCVWEAFLDHYGGNKGKLSSEINKAFEQDLFDEWVQGLLFNSDAVDCIE